MNENLILTKAAITAFFTAVGSFLGWRMIMLLVWAKEDSDKIYDSLSLYAQQKGVDMKIGMDIASLAYKKQVDQIVLIAGDADFVPAAKLARREGIDFVLDPLGHKIKDDLFEHIDGKRSCGDPYKKSEAKKVPVTSK